MTQDTITKIDNLLRSVTDVALAASSSMDALLELAQRPSIKKPLNTRQLDTLTSLTALAMHVHFVTCDLRQFWLDMKGNRR